MKTNDLKFKTSKVCGDETIYVSIRLNDECKNGHEDFAITGDIYETDKPRIDKYCLGGGCIHEDILKHFPEFKIFIDLHLSDCNGIPMYAVENGFYHLKSGFNSKSTGNEFENEFCQYYRMTPDQFKIIKNSENQLEYAILLKELGIMEHWKEQAKQAIKILEDLTGNEFESKAIKTQYHEPEADKIQEFKKLKSEGFYSDEKKRERAIIKAKEAKEKIISDLKTDAEKQIKKIQLERDIKLFLVSQNIKLDSVIFYSHSKELCFNWLDSEYRTKITELEFKRIKKAVERSMFYKNADIITISCKGL